MIFGAQNSPTSRGLAQERISNRLLRSIGRFFAGLFGRILLPGAKRREAASPPDHDYQVEEELGVVHGRLLHNSGSLQIRLNATQAAPPQGWVRAVTLIDASRKP